MKLGNETRRFNNQTHPNIETPVLELLFRWVSNQAKVPIKNYLSIRLFVCTKL